MYHGERFNSISHLVGAGLAVVGTIVLVIVAALEGDPWKIFSFAVFGSTLCFLYIISTLYHSIKGPAKQLFQKLDHVAIYLLIAGSYTPFTLITLQGSLGWIIFGIIWGVALLGIAQEVWLAKADGARVLSIVLYLIMGWLAVIALVPLLNALKPEGLAWLIAGGVFYTAGIIFYVLDERMRHAHGIWHLFVLGGSVTHYFTVLLFVA
ncbi:MAG: hemolysin III family protein [Gammaproteobacteria bacterium]|nr:hemolysin III family protein [Gammaproteobacteria bacterium]